MASKVKTALLGQIWLVEPRGEFVGGDETDELRTALDEANKAGATKLLVDLAGVSYLNSTALGVLIAGHTSFTKRGAEIVLCNVSDNIRNIFVITKLTLVFTIYESRDEALKHLE
ncbi:MAG: STAS domain-containing protein [Bacteroidetes bacterium]|nr:STAS domain-containing protein [Bacteroidota bacterium]